MSGARPGRGSGVSGVARRRALVVALVASAGASLAGCSAPPKPFPVSEILADAPAIVSSGEPTLQITIVPARRYLDLEAASAVKKLLTVPLTRAPSSGPATGADPTYGAPLGYPVTFATRSPFFVTLQDGFLRFATTAGDRPGLTATVESAKGKVPPAIAAPDELWVWIGREPTKDYPDPRGTFVGAHVAREP